MTFKILKSQMPEGFEVSVAAHALEMRNWRAHMARVKADQDANVEPAKRHVGYDRPMAHLTVAAAVNENDAADYELIDDSPTPDQILVAKKIYLLNAVSVAEDTAITAILPSAGKRRLFDIREGDIRSADAARAATLKPGMLGAAASAIGLIKPIDVAAELAKGRDPEDTAHLAAQAERRGKTDLVRRAAAQMHSDIEDLTIDNVDAWVMPKFPD